MGWAWLLTQYTERASYIFYSLITDRCSVSENWTHHDPDLTIPWPRHESVGFLGSFLTYGQRSPSFNLLLAPLLSCIHFAGHCCCSRLLFLPTARTSAERFFSSSQMVILPSISVTCISRVPLTIMTNRLAKATSWYRRYLVRILVRA